MKIHKKLFYTGTVILNCLLTACQETPKEDIVKNKAESNLEDEVQQSTQADTEEDSSTKISEQIIYVFLTIFLYLLKCP